MNTNISIPENRLAAFCKANGITRFALFGSVLLDDFGPDSDVDVLVEFEPERIPGLLGVAAMEMALVKEIEIVGEAAARVSEATREHLPDIPWDELVGMRNRLVHA